MKVLSSIFMFFLLVVPAKAEMKVILLGTGTPFADPEKSGPSTAVIVNGVSWIVDAGPGVVRRASSAHIAGEPALAQAELSRLLLTHLHSDHTLGLPDLMYSPWVLGRTTALKVWGPPGIKDMAANIEEAYTVDLKVRLEGAEGGNKSGWKTTVIETNGGIIFQDAALKIEAIPVCHGGWDIALGYKFTHEDKVVVISGDTTYCPSLEAASHDADVLIQEVYDSAALTNRTPKWQNYHSKAHTSDEDLGKLAANAGVKKLVLYHQLVFGKYGGSKDAIIERIASTYSGPITWGEDLMVIDVN